ncbi:MAG: amidophosphoribosyltransferase [Candidatus Nitrohelix vancouverensis]|uniref:Amidophosphoribosyltransferase n=1 Tax=Candidatus Nitrohelix vancouverensis TaxID=2705534 RepID=A0A7T0C1D7_9BACT|nr:MAG: amidophosphoribosyltransferase [Candidatus Nitrohelix vancouverensis]
MLDELHEECGVMGVFGNPEAANLVYLGLYALQHRGQESAGIVSSEDGKLHLERGMGLVADVFNGDRLKKLPGDIAIGHNRYSTTGDSATVNAQPCLIKYAIGSLALAHNGNLVNSLKIRKELGDRGSIFQSTNDSEVIVHLMAQARGSFKDRAAAALGQVKGAYSLLLLSEDAMIAARDPNGFRPLCLGKVGDGYVVASESCVMDLIDATYIREIDPGELLLIDKDGLHSFFPFEKAPMRQCVFEHIYFARPDSYLFSDHVYTIRKEMGKALAEEGAVDADVVIPVPDSGVISSMGYSEASGIPFEMGLIRNHYVGRTFIEPQHQIRNFGVRVKLSGVRSQLEGKRVVVIDDSIVRGTTSRKIVKMLREAGAKEVHVRICSPPILHSCFYGIDTPTRSELVASANDTEAICKFIEADTLHYLSLERMMKVFGKNSENFCSACFDGNYPVEVVDAIQEEPQLDLFPLSE